MPSVRIAHTDFPADKIITLVKCHIKYHCITATAKTLLNVSEIIMWQ